LANEGAKLVLAARREEKLIDIAQALAYVINTPERVSVSDMIIRPTKQVM